MTRARFEVPIDELSTQPLCRGYQVIALDQLVVSISSDWECARLILALGVTPDGKREALGVWPWVADGDAEEILADLCRRGIEKVRFASARTEFGLEPALKAWFPTTVLVPREEEGRSRRDEAMRRGRDSNPSDTPSFSAASACAAARASVPNCGVPREAPSTALRGVSIGADEGPSMHELPPSDRRHLLASQAVAGALQRKLELTSMRKGCFVNIGEAMAFVARSLHRCERRLAGRDMVRAACTKHRTGASKSASGRHRVEALGL